MAVVSFSENRSMNNAVFTWIWFSTCQNQASLGYHHKNVQKVVLHRNEKILTCIGNMVTMKYLSEGRLRLTYYIFHLFKVSGTAGIKTIFEVRWWSPHRVLFWLFKLLLFKNAIASILFLKLKTKKKSVIDK